jgi:hypothetical protein
MIAIANLQYGWTLFVGPMNDKFHWERTDIQVAFSIFALLETWLAPFDRCGHCVGLDCRTVSVVRFEAVSCPLAGYSGGRPRRLGARARSSHRLSGLTGVPPELSGKNT